MPAFGTFAYNTNLYDGGVFAGNVYSVDRFVFDSFSLSDGSSMICEKIVDSGPTRDIVGGNIPRGDGVYVTAAYFRERTIQASGWCTASTAAALDTLLDTIRKNLRKKEANLDITDAAVTVRRFTATCDNYESLFAGRDGHDITICPWTAHFTCKTPFGFSRSYTSTFASVSGSPNTLGASPGGDYKTNAVIYVSFATASSVTSIDITNTTTGDEMTYTGTAEANDLFVFDGENKSVTKNGIAVDYVGNFISLEPNGNSVVFTINGTSTEDITIKAKTCYL